MAQAHLALHYFPFRDVRRATPADGKEADQFGESERWQRLLPESAGPGTQVSLIGETACAGLGEGLSGAENHGSETSVAEMMTNK